MHRRRVADVGESDAPAEPLQLAVGGDAVVPLAREQLRQQRARGVERAHPLEHVGIDADLVGAGLDAIERAEDPPLEDLRQPEIHHHQEARHRGRADAGERGRRGAHGGGGEQARQRQQATPAEEPRLALGPAEEALDAGRVRGEWERAAAEIEAQVELRLELVHHLLAPADQCGIGGLL